MWLYAVVAVLTIMLVVSLVLAIGSRKRLKKEVHWLTSILDTIPMPLSVTDSNMNWTFVNRADDGKAAAVSIRKSFY
jgi:methyl-accepting chemotaxis protein